ncbi:MarR family winged helix-turn-helix transcriptional regulator [Lolliginicoccus levis]|uniref:MarR family winged helix-turn-helix transcriptional regulator n=1 Tax=Lolliginicoccus levis TaxID=2919542 RepID=UPI00241DBA07|nr:MarR family winged helix-turn-helix transcriptional regulator [Lolliginicoccus levis]
MSEETAATEACDLGWSIAMVGRRYAAIVDPIFEGFPRGARGYQLLHTVVHKRIPTQNALADYLGIDRTVMPYFVDDLQSAGFVGRQDDPSDRRVRTVIATPEGVAEYEKLSRQVQRAEQAFFEGITEGDRALLVRSLSLLARRSRSYEQSKEL